ncbi:MAG: hypothetical protein PHO83_15080 [Geobacteraceae bacterium]|nr:hypothetical protein [Geobacteraceae bacterium]
MSEYKKYTLRIVAFLLFFIAANAVVWKCWTEKILSSEYHGGDLARMGYLPDSKLLRTNHEDLPLRHLEDTEYQGQPIKVLTIGDSFSNGGGSGKNRYYQDYIASINHCNVLNIEPYQSQNFLELVVTLLHNGYLEKVRPEYLIFSASEKFCVEKYALGIDFSAKTDFAQSGTLQRMGYNSTGNGPGVTFMNEGNFKFLLNSFLYRFSDRAFFSKTFTRELSAPLFTSKDPRRLLFYRDDIRKTALSTPRTVSMLNDNLNTVADMLRKKGIRFYFMPCVDKYNLYSDFIVDNPYPRSTFFEELRKLPKRYTLIDTKAILLPELKRGTKDIFYPDDTHWSWKASEKIFETVRFP